jgi:hypothetical protein
MIASERRIERRAVEGHDVGGFLPARDGEHSGMGKAFWDGKGLFRREGTPLFRPRIEPGRAPTGRCDLNEGAPGSRGAKGPMTIWHGAGEGWDLWHRSACCIPADISRSSRS